MPSLPTMTSPPEKPVVTLWHDPDCPKSCQAVALLHELGFVELTVRLYLEQPPDAEELAAVVSRIGRPVRDLIRTDTPLYQTQGLDDPTLSDGALIDLLSRYPSLLERPIVTRGDRARLGRPAYRALEILVPAGQPPKVYEMLKSKIKEEGLEDPAGS